MWRSVPEQEMRWITHEGKKILFTTFHGGLPEFKETTKRQQALVERQEGKTLFLNDLSGLHVDRSLVQEAIKYSKRVEEYAAKGAIYGLKAPFKQMISTLATITNIDYKDFDTREEALAWLVED